MNLAKISSNGQVTIPVDIRRRLGLRGGDKLLFIERENGDVVIDNASATTIVKAQTAFTGVAEKLGNPGENDIQSWVDEVRYGEDHA